jgi:tetratricopeptide (TPR) repeat protein
MKLFLLVLALGAITGHVSADNKANRKHAIIKVSGIIVLILLTLMNIGSAAQSSSDDLIKQGVELMNSRNPDNYTKAIKVFEQAIDNNQQDFYAWWLKGNALRRLTKYDEAIIAYNRSIYIKPQYSEAWNNNGIVFYYLNRFDEAIAAFDKAIEINKQNPNASKAWNNKGVTLISLDKYDEAIAAYDKAIEVNQQDKVAWNNKGLALYNLTKYDEALVVFVNVTKMDPQYPNAWYHEGKTLDKLGKSDEAKNAYKQANTLPGLWSPLEEDKTPAVSPISSYTPWYQNLVNSVYDSVIVLVCSNVIVKGITVLITTVGAILLNKKLRGKGI